MTQFELVKRNFFELDNTARSSVRLSNPTQTEAVHNVSAHRLPRYYPPQLVPFSLLELLQSCDIHAVNIAKLLTHLSINPLNP